MAKRELADFEVWQQQGFDALERRKAAEKEIVRTAVALTSGARVWQHEDGRVTDNYQKLMVAVRSYNQAEADLKASQDALDARARSR
jgi:hypothetical protein